jgi:hypothetical protein
VEAERHTVPLEQLVDDRRVPGGFAELDHVRDVAGEEVEEVPQPIQIELPSRWQLIQHGSEVPSERSSAAEEALQRLFRVLQLLHVGEEPAGLDREQKPARRTRRPGGEGLSLG